MKWKYFPRYWPFVRRVPHTKTSDAELWCFLWSGLNKRWSKQSWGWWFETPSRPLWRHCNVLHCWCNNIVNAFSMCLINAYAHSFFKPCVYLFKLRLLCLLYCDKSRCISILVYAEASFQYAIRHLRVRFYIVSIPQKYLHHFRILQGPIFYRPKWRVAKRILAVCDKTSVFLVGTTYFISYTMGFNDIATGQVQMTRNVQKISLIFFTYIWA